MKLYLLLSLAFAVVQMSSSDEPTLFRCLSHEPVILCPTGDALKCGNYCSDPIADGLQLNKLRWLCINTHPPMMCPLAAKAWCIRYCKSAAGVTMFNTPNARDNVR